MRQNFRSLKIPDEVGGSIGSTAVSIRASGPSCPGFDSQGSRNYFCDLTKFVAVTEVNQQRCLEESGQWLENVDRTHLVLASGKLVLQRILKKPDLTPFI